MPPASRAETLDLSCRVMFDFESPERTHADCAHTSFDENTVLSPAGSEQGNARSVRPRRQETAGRPRGGLAPHRAPPPAPASAQLPPQRKWCAPVATCSAPSMPRDWEVAFPRTPSA